MEFSGFSSKDFETFHIDGLEERMTAIQERIQPKFRVLGETLTEHVGDMVGSEMYLHIAKHARRTVNPPNDTWLAIAGNKRGYKKHPHFQVGLWEDHIFIWLAFIYELPDKSNMAENFLKHQDIIRQLPNEYVISDDHMKNQATPLSDIDLEHTLTRFRDVKKAEFLIGRHVKAEDPVAGDGAQFLKLANDTFSSLVPLYRLAFQS